MRPAIAVILLFVFAKSDALSQDLSLTTFKSLVSKNLSDCETVLLKKEFDYLKHEVADTCYTYTYTYGYEADSKKAKSFVFLSICKTFPYCVGYQFTEKSVYLEFKEELRLKGYKLIDTKSDDPTAIEYEYQLGNNSDNVIKISVNRDNEAAIYLVTFAKPNNS